MDMLDSGNTAWICGHARAVGFDLCGVVRLEKFPELARFEEWLERGYAEEMKYLEDPRRRDPLLVQENLRSAIVCALNYNTAHPYSVEAAAVPQETKPLGWISRYAWGDDYHEILWKKLNQLETVILETHGQDVVTRAYADTGPVAERVLARHAGLGWIGKNTLLLNEEMGSWFFLGVVLTSLELAPSVGPAQTLPADLCGNCRQCLDACPTGALVEPYLMDARRCISYLTIELGDSIPVEFRESMGWQVYGCDICQDVCPFNHAAPATSAKEFQPRETTGERSLLMPSLEWLASLTQTEFSQIFQGSAMKRTKWRGLVRNACIALGNARLSRSNPNHASAIELLGHLEQSEEKVISESARWALRRIQ